MKSPMIETASYIKEDEKSGYSDIRVMKSAAGYYLGTVYTDPEDGFQEPGSRDSGYMTKEQAIKELKLLEQGDSELELQMTP